MTHSLIFAICSSAPVIFYPGNGDYSIWYDLLLLFCMFVNEKQLAVLLVNCFVLGKYRDVTKISNYRVKLSRWGIRQLGISFGYIFLLFPSESIHGKILARAFQWQPWEEWFFVPKISWCYPPPPSLYASMHIFRHVLFPYFASLSSGLPILVQVFLRELCLPINGYVSLNKVSFWTRRVLKSVKMGKKDYFCATNDHFFPKNLIPLC